MRVKTGTEGKTKDVAVVDVTPENYIVPDNEKHLYHCIIEVRKFDPETGNRLSVPRVQMFGKKTFENGVSSNLKKQGYTVTILHDPNDWLAQKNEADKAKAAQIAAQKAEADKQAAEEAKAAEDARIAKAVADALAKNAEDEQKRIDAAVAKALKAQEKAEKPATGKAEGEK